MSKNCLLPERDAQMSGGSREKNHTLKIDMRTTDKNPSQGVHD